MGSQSDKAILNAIFNPFLPIGEDVVFIEDDADDGELCDFEKELMEEEKVGVKTSEEGHYEKALEIFTQIITKAPERSSGYNNRAQVYRLLHQVDEALADVNTAISLCKGKGRVGRQALCQRGLIYRKQGRDEESLQDFKMAAEAGSSYAKSQLVEQNPYAALCNKMLTEVIYKLKNID